MTGMMGSIAAEVFILRKRVSTWVLLGIWLLLGTLFAYVLPYNDYRSGGDDFRPVPLAELIPSGLTGLSGGFAFFGGSIALMLGVLSVGSDYGWGTTKTLFTQGPSRMRIFGSKLIALGVVLVPFVLLLYGIGAVASSLIATQEDAAITFPAAQNLIEALLASWFILAAWTALGVMLAVLTRGTALAIGVGILYSFLIEGLISSLVDSVSALERVVELFLRANGYSLAAVVGASRDSVSDNGPGGFSGPYVSGTQAVLVLGAYMLIFLGIAAFALRKRDVA